MQVAQADSTVPWVQPKVEFTFVRALKCNLSHFKTCNYVNYLDND